MSNTVLILLDNLTPEGLCYAGQTITGRVECNFSSEKKLRAVQIKFEGKCNTSWSQATKEYDNFHKDYRKKNVTYKAEEIYFTQEYNLIGDGTEFKLTAGKYTYPFSYVLPQLLPSSFKHDLGKVEYSVKATVDCPWRFDDTDTVVLKLLSPLDLNSFPQLRQPVEVSVDKTMFSWSFKGSSDPLTFRISLPFSAYAAGQQVKVNAHVENLTNVKVEKVNFKITRSMEFTVHYPSTCKRQSEQTLVSWSEGGIGVHSEKRWISTTTIPADPIVPNMVHCKLITVSYRLHAELVVPFPHINLTTDIPLMVGNIPLRDLNTARPLVPTNADRLYPVLPNSGVHVPTAPPLEGLASAPPPTYEELQIQEGASNNPVPQQVKPNKDEDAFELI